MFLVDRTTLSYVSVVFGVSVFDTSKRERERGRYSSISSFLPARTAVRTQGTNAGLSVALDVDV